MWQDARRDVYEWKERGTLAKDSGCEGVSGEIRGRGNRNGDGALTESEWGVERGVERKDGTDGNERKWTVPLQACPQISKVDMQSGMTTTLY